MRKQNKGNGAKENRRKQVQFIRSIKSIKSIKQVSEQMMHGYLSTIEPANLAAQIRMITKVRNV